MHLLAGRYDDVPAVAPPVEDFDIGPVYGGLGGGDPMALLPWMDERLAFGPSTLDPDAPPPFPAAPPLASEELIAANADKSTAEDLLMSKDFGTHETAVQALEILVQVPEAQRARVIDELDDAAFENLLVRVPDADRERFASLVDASQDPERKLRMWAEFHKSRATNDVARLKGDTGTKGSRTEEQKEALRMHKQRKKTAKETRSEVDIELDELQALATSGTLTLADVDAMRARKELEYALEREHALNFTASDSPRADGSRVFWGEDELRRVDATLDQLPDEHILGPKELGEMRRAEGESSIGGLHGASTITMTDAGVVPGTGFRHGGEPRAMVSDELRAEHGDHVDRLEFVLAHELGHEYAEHHEDAFCAFKAAAGWTQKDAATLRKEHSLTDADLAVIDGDRHAGRTPFGGSVSKFGKTYTPGVTSDLYWSVDTTAIPAADEAAPDVHGGDSWTYAWVNPGEHFAETYAKAAVAPEKLYGDLVERPAEAAREAKQALAMKQRELAGLAVSSPDRDALRDQVIALEREATRTDQAQRQRFEQYSIMRDDVFDADGATEAASERLRQRGASAAQIRAFEERAIRAMTPQQVEALEADVP